MIYSTQELYLKYKDFKTPHIKIKTEVKNQRLFPVVRGLYEDNKETEGYLLIDYIKPDSYLSFEYVLSKAGLIPERVGTYTCATTLKKHSTSISTSFGRYSFDDVPVSVYRYGVKCIQEGKYGYLIASPEKALCDLLYKKSPVYSLKELKRLLFEDLRIDEDILLSLNKQDILFLCPLYKKKNLDYLKKYMEDLYG